MQTDVYSQTPPETRSATALADFWIQRILGRSMAEADRAAVISVMAQEYTAEEALPDEHVQYALPAMVEVILMSPDFQWK
jgi:hypothetical protein